MNTSLVVVASDASWFKYEIAMSIFRSDMIFIDWGMASSITYDSSVMNMYIDEAIRLMH